MTFTDVRRQLHATMSTIIYVAANDNAIHWRELRRWRRWLQGTHG